MQAWRFRVILLLIVLIVLSLASGQAAWADSGKAIIIYQVQQGDTLWLLAQRYGTTVSTIQQLNQLSGEGLTPAQVLFLPVTTEGNNYAYKVQRGDTLYLISLRTQRPIAAIQTANSLQGDMIYAGQTLYIPLAAPGCGIYLVKPGDSLYLIASRFQLTVNELASFNKLASDLIMAGQVLQLPGSGDTKPQPQPPPQQPELAVYRVKSGDTLSIIAQKYNTSIKAIYDTNRLNSDILMPGQPLYIAANSHAAVEVEGPRGEQKAGYGEFLDWEWARWIYNVGAVATVTDLDSGLSFPVRHLGGSNHADSEPLTAADTAVMKQIFAGQWSWNTRAILVKTAGRVLAASMSGQPHDIQTILDNDFPGHFDIYFWNSRSHNNNQIHPQHQANVLRAAGRDSQP